MNNECINWLKRHLENKQKEDLEKGKKGGDFDVYDGS